ncbi:hypothetical protein PIB30_037444 [Stylosanthes scabra]|uniref:Uncharacterized protein n=1 Tax=Stylosanthes scabra TaxID=79078 RepID=A0ABU6SDL0_9FABA|nr:hypothetical protein [Stylosanthes scabra]
MRDGWMIEVHEAYPLPATGSFYPVSSLQVPPPNKTLRRWRAQHIVGRPPIDEGQFTRDLNRPLRRLITLKIRPFSLPIFKGKNNNYKAPFSPENSNREKRNKEEG